jgi:hypothetical protein
MPPDSSRPGAYLPRWAVAFTYAGFAALLLCGALSWLSILFEYLVHGRFELGELDRSWLETARSLRRLAYPALHLGLACGGLAFLLALPAWNTADAALQAHKRYQRRSAAILLLLPGLVCLSHGRMGAFDADIAAVAAFAWGAWVVTAGWRALAGGRTVSGPAGWGLALTVVVLTIVTLAVFWIALEIEGIRVI